MFIFSEFDPAHLSMYQYNITVRNSLYALLYFTKSFLFFQGNSFEIFGIGNFFLIIVIRKLLCHVTLIL